MNAVDGSPFGDRVQEWRHDNRWTQQRLADALGYDVSYIAKIEQGRRRPSKQFLARISVVLAPTGTELPGLRQPSDLIRLPVPAGAVVGRAEDIARVCTLLRGSRRLVTLVGAPGVGKTSLALEVAWHVAKELRHGACFVSLADVTDAAAVPAAVGAGLGMIQPAGADPAALVAEVLRAREALVVLDNFEHVLAASPFLEALVREAPDLRILVTSREAPTVEGAAEYRVRSLAFPDPAGPPVERVQDYPAIDMFVTKARAVRPGFALTGANAQAVAEICARLDGLPLAIGLAASASAFLSPADILASLGGRLDLPTGDPDGGAAHEPLTAALQWSWDLLRPGQRTLLARLAVFSGGSTLVSTEAVCGEGTDDVLAGLAALTRKNLVEVVHGDDRGRSRFTLLETVRRFGLQRLAAAGEVESIHRRHCDHFLSLAEEAAPHVTGGPEQARWLRTLDDEYANLASALGWAIGNDPQAGLRLGAALWRFFSMRRIADGRVWLGALLDTDGGADLDRLRVQIGAAVLARLQADLDGARGLLDAALVVADRLGAGPERALAVLNLGIVDEQRGYYDRAEVRFHEALAMSAAADDDRAAGHALNCLGVIALHRGDTDDASAMFLDALDRFRALDDGWSVAVTATNMGWIAESNDVMVDARAWYDESRQIWDAVGDEHGSARSLADLGRIARRQRCPAQAGPPLQAALQVFRRLGDRRLAAACLLELAAVSVQGRRTDQAARLLGAAEGLRDALRMPAWPQERLLEKGVVDDLSRAMDGAALDRARGVGRTLSVEDAVELAECGTWPPPAQRRVRTPPLQGALAEVARRAQPVRPLVPAAPVLSALDATVRP